MQKAKLRPFGKFNQHPRHRRRYRDPFPELPPLVHTHSYEEYDEIAFKLSGHTRGHYLGHFGETPWLTPIKVQRLSVNPSANLTLAITKGLRRLSRAAVSRIAKLFSASAHGSSWHSASDRALQHHGRS
jgi:hypothetical protein